MTKLTVKVNKITQEAEDIRSFELVDPAGKLLPMFTAGGHIDIELPNGLPRQYSISNDPRDVDRYVIAVLREVAGRGGSAYLHDSVKEGDLLTIGTPRNNFPLHEGAKHHILLAGGIGMTPMLAMARELATRGESFEMHYCTRTPEKTAFMKEIQDSAFADKVKFHHDNGNPAQGLDIAALLKDVREATHVYYCGPTGFMHACEQASAHWQRGTVHCEYFSVDASVTHGADEAFQIKIASTGQVFDVPADKSIVDVLRSNGFDVETMCEEGICGTCATVMLEGEADHRDFVLDDEEKARGEFIMVCCSRAKSPMLTLDL
ncbi:MAG: PDR/VanB family oxidoreductase [Proteobacteria bacterium]|nr:PDR/VanB family oxidoreductase [Pseudomonadota bacterium]